MPIQLIHNDITKMQVDAIVNSANKKLTSGAGVCSAIHKAAGPDLEKACLKLCGCATGKATLTQAYRLPCKFVIHTVAPSWTEGTQTEKSLLFSCYSESLKIAKSRGCKSIAFPLLSSGLLHCPEESAIKIAVKSISSFLKDNSMQVYLILFTQSAMKVGKELYPHLVYFTNEEYLSAPKFAPQYSSVPPAPVKKKTPPPSFFSQSKYNPHIQNSSIPHIQNASIPSPLTKNLPSIPKKATPSSANLSIPDLPTTSKEISLSNSTLFVHKGIIACIKYKHPIVDATAILKNLNGRNIELNVQHCKSCNRFFIQHDIYQHYRKKYGAILGDIRMHVSESPNSYLPDLALESALHLCGYSVSLKDSLSEAARHAIIVSVIESGIMKKHEVIKLIQYLIELNHSKKTHQDAIQKWENDLDFTLAYNTDRQKKFQLHTIIPYSRNRYIVQGVLVEPTINTTSAKQPKGKRKRIYIPDPQYGYGNIISESDYRVTAKFDNGEIFTLDRSLINSGFVQVVQQKPQITVLQTPPDCFVIQKKTKNKTPNNPKAPQRKNKSKSASDTSTSPVSASNKKQPPISANPKIGCVHLDGVICSLKDSPCKNAESNCLFFKTY